MRAVGWFGFTPAAFDSVDERGEAISYIQRGRLAGQQMVAQGPQGYRQVGEQLLGRGVGFARAVAANHRNQDIGGGALGVEVGQGRVGEGGIEVIGHAGVTPDEGSRTGRGAGLARAELAPRWQINIIIMSLSPD